MYVLWGLHCHNVKTPSRPSSNFCPGGQLECSPDINHPSFDNWQRVACSTGLDQRPFERSREVITYKRRRRRRDARNCTASQAPNRKRVAPAATWTSPFTPVVADVEWQNTRTIRWPILRGQKVKNERQNPVYTASGSGESHGEDTGPVWRTAASKMIEGCATAFGSILILGIAGYSYNAYYKAHVLSKMENAFALGYSSVEIAALSRHVKSEGSHAELFQAETFEDNDWIPRAEQEVLDKIVDGTMRGQYHLITGEKGTGKTSMLLKAMGKIGGEGVAMFEAHGDPEIFRVRLGKALDFEFHEDYVGSLFSFKGPRDTTALLDIERAFNKMEKIALRRKEKVGKPLVLIITGAHLIRDDEDGQDLLELIQQRAELWAASNLVTVVFNSDDYWTTERLMWQATRLRVTPVRDIPKDIAIESLRQFRKTRGEDVPTSILEQVYSKVGGRLSFLTRAAKSPDMISTCNTICEKEKRWLLNKCWILGADM